MTKWYNQRYNPAMSRSDKEFIDYFQITQILPKIWILYKHALQLVCASAKLEKHLHND